MSRLAFRYAFRAVADVHSRALLTGLLLGALVHALATQREGSEFALAMAFVMVVSGTIAFVLHALATSGTRGAATPASRVRGWVIALGSGLLAAVHGLASIGG